MAGDRYVFDGLEGFEKRLRRMAADVDYLVVWDTLGRFELTLADALPYLELAEELVDRDDDDDLPPDDDPYGLVPSPGKSPTTVACAFLQTVPAPRASWSLGAGGLFQRCVQVSLDPLVTDRWLALQPTPGVLEAKLVEVEIASRNRGNEVTIVRGEDLLHRMSDSSMIEQGRLRAARLKLRLRVSAACARLRCGCPMAWPGIGGARTRPSGGSWRRVGSSKGVGCWTVRWEDCRGRRPKGAVPAAGAELACRGAPAHAARRAWA